jgi:DNA topoisomerase VI subunit B
MNVSAAFRCFFSLLFGGTLPEDVAKSLGFVKASAAKPAPPAPPPVPPKPQATPADGAVQIIAALQRESRIIDFLMEDISAYTDDQVGAAVRDVAAQARQSLDRYLKLQPVIDAVEETNVPTAGLDSASYKLIGKVPANGKASSGILRHRGWKASNVELPQAKPTNIIAQAELEIE